MLSYPALLTIIEHLEAVKRIHLCSRALKLRSIDKPTPLHLETLYLGPFEVYLNNIAISILDNFEPENQDDPFQNVIHIDSIRNFECLHDNVLTPGDLLLEPPINRHHLYVDFFNMHTGQFARKELPIRMTRSVAMKKLTTFLLGERPPINVEEFIIAQAEWDEQKVFRLPPGLKINASNFNVTGLHTGMHGLETIVNSLEQLKIGSHQLKYARCPIFGVAKCLVIDNRDGISLEELARVPHENISFDQQGCSPDFVVAFIKALRESGKKIGVYRIESRSLIKHHLLIINEKLRKSFGAVSIQENGSSLSPVCIPMDDDTEVTVYGVSTSSTHNDVDLQFELVPRGTSTPVVPESSTSTEGSRMNEGGTCMLWILAFLTILIATLVKSTIINMSQEDQTTQNEFVLTHVIQNVSGLKESIHSYSKEMDHFGVEWRLGFAKINGYMSACLICCKPRLIGQPWSINASIAMKLISADGNTFSRPAATTFANTDAINAWGFREFERWRTVEDHFVSNDEMILEARVVINEMIGIEEMKPLRTFDESVADESDVVLRVGEKRFYVSKLTLASQSSYFKSLFLGKFEEASQQEVCLNDIDPEHFRVFLELVYLEPALTNSNVQGVLVLADMYDAKYITRVCEQFMIHESVDSLRNKMKIAVEYKLEKLKSHCFVSMKTKCDVRSVMDLDMDLQTYKEIAEKLLSFK